jgi:hypothetical protein
VCKSKGIRSIWVCAQALGQLSNQPGEVRCSTLTGTHLYRSCGPVAVPREVLGSPYQSTPLGESTAVGPLGRFAYIGNGTQLYAFSIARSRSGMAGALVRISGSSFFADYVAVDVTGSVLFTVSTSANMLTVYAINQTTGRPTPKGFSYPMGTNPHFNHHDVTIDWLFSRSR